MGSERARSKGLRLAILAGLAVALAGCGSKEAPAPAAAGGPPVAQSGDPGMVAAGDATPASAPLDATDQNWTPEAMEALLAPIALYPDPVLTQVLMSATNPQEVLDAGNWLIANPDTNGKALDQATEQAGFTPPMRALMQFRQIVDQMCLEMGWTTELGQAFTNDEAGVLAAVQRLRVQAMDVGNLQSSEQMTVETKTQDGQQAIVIEPPSPEVVYVPTYDPVAVYAPAPAAAVAPAAAAPATTTTTTSTGHSTGSMVATGLLSFGAGLLVAEIFDDDDDYYRGGSYYYPNYGGGYMRPPPPYYYRPSYGNGYRPGHSYNRPPSYNNVLSNNNVVVVNNNKNNNYWNNFDDKPKGRNRANDVKSPITAAKPNRPELGKLNQDAKAPKARPVQAAAGGGGAKSDWKGQSGYAGAKPAAREKARLPPESKAVSTKAASNAATARQKASTTGGDRGYAGAASRPDAGKARDVQKPTNVSRPANMPAKPANISKPVKPTNVSKPANLSKPAAAPSRPKPAAAPAAAKPRNTAVAGSGRAGGGERAASQRGRSSMPQGAKKKSGGGQGKNKR